MSRKTRIAFRKTGMAVREKGIWPIARVSQQRAMLIYLEHCQYIGALQASIQKRPAHLLLALWPGLDQSFYRGYREGDLQPPPCRFSLPELARKVAGAGAAIIHPVPARPYGTL